MKLNVESVSDMTRKNAVLRSPILSSSSSSSEKKSLTEPTEKGAMRTWHDEITLASVSGDRAVDLKPLYRLRTNHSSERRAASSLPCRFTHHCL